MSALWLGLKRGLSAVGLTLMLAEGAVAAGLMTPADGSLPALEIKQHHVNVMVEDGYAITTIDQQFYNPNNMALEAVYSFPLPEKASVAEFTYWIDGKPVVGEVLEKAKAETIYQQEKSNGRRAAITEQDRYHSFDSRVYPVLPQQEVKLRLVYLQPVHIDTSIGRYVYPLEEGGVDEQKLSFWRYNEAVTEAFSFNLTMRSSYPIDDFRLPQHPQATITQGSAKQWQVSFNNGAAANNDEESVTVSSASSVQTLDKDIVVYWRHQQGLPGSVDMISYKSANSDRGTFMLSVTPGDDLANIQSGRDWVFVLDISGSMKGKYQSLVEGVKKGLAKLSSNDRYKIVLFNNTAHELTQGYTAVSADNISRSIERLENNSPGGGTNLYEGLEKGIKGLDADRASAILLVTDGVANVGMKEKKRLFSPARAIRCASV
jgi:Ca-activated chloride channel family protein